MSLNVKKLTSLARMPVESTDGSYELYAGNNYVIPAKSNVTVSTGLAISIPTGYNARVYSTSAAESNNIDVSNFCSINHHSYKSTLNQTVQELKIILRNDGNSEFNVKRGDQIARMLVHQIKRLPIHEVENLDDITQDFSAEMKMRNIKSFPGRVQTWFVMEYRNNPTKAREKYTTPEIITELETFKQTQEYIRSKTKDELEAKFVYRKIEKCEDLVDNGKGGTETLFDRAKGDHTIAKIKAQAI